jgi:hypothetical protein
MWSEREREQLVVWADRAQAEGEALGELVATSLAAEDLVRRDPKDPRLEALHARIFELETAVRDPMVADLFANFPELEPRWEHGMLVGLRLVTTHDGRRFDDDHVEALRRLLRLPVSRFLRHVRVDALHVDGGSLHARVAALLTEPEIVARPWTLILGAPPRHQRRRDGPERLPLPPEQRRTLVDPARGLRMLYHYQVRIDLPWQRGDKGTRLRAAASLADGRHDEPTTVTRLVRALWDPSLRVRLRILDTLPLLGVEAAPLIPGLLLVTRGELEWLNRVREVLGTLARNPELVATVARNFDADQPRCASWLSESPLAAASLAVPRMQTMLLGPRHLDGWSRAELDAALRKLDRTQTRRERSRALDARTPGSAPLLKRLRRWLSG